MYDIQSRWKLEENGSLKYYGLRNQPYLFKNTIKLSKRQAEIVKRLPCRLTEDDIAALGALIGSQIVKVEDKIKIPTCFEEARFCSSCVSNDFMIPGIEFDEDGRCPICQSAEETKKIKKHSSYNEFLSNIQKVEI